MRLRLPTLLSLVFIGLLTAGANGCSSDPNVEGAKLNLQNGEYDDALRNISVALENNPDNVEALGLKAQILATQMGEVPFAERAALVPDAVEAANRGVQLEPENARAVEIRDFVWSSVMQTGNQSLQNDATPAADAIPFFRGAVQLAPDSSASHYSLGLAEFFASENEGAAASFERAIELAPMESISYIYLSKAYLAMDRGADAVDILQTALNTIPTTDPQTERLQQEYLNTLATSGQTERAIAEFEARLETNGNDPIIRYNYGTLLLGVERYEDAIAEFTRATELEANNVDAYYNLGVANLRLADQKLNEANDLGLDASQADYDALIAERDASVEASLAALVTARDMADDDDRARICNTLTTIYNSLGRADEADEAAQCAGISN